jgi:hypothetical protein
MPAFASRVACLLPLCLVALASLGCDSIRLSTVESSETVVSRRPHAMPSTRSVRARTEVDGAKVFIETKQGCDLVDMETVRRIEILEGDEEPQEELAVLGIASLPLTTGIVILIDSPNVHDKNPNDRLYNPTGQKGAIIAGSILTALGSLLVAAPTIHLMRVAAAGDERETTFDRPGAVLERNVRCEGSERPLRTTVQVGVGEAIVWTSTTNPDGKLHIDLARVVPRALVDQHATARVLIVGEQVAEVDMETIRAAQSDLELEREEQVWGGVDVDRCRRAAPGDAQSCRGVEAFLQMFPDGVHADEARRLLEGRSRGPVIARDPIEAARTACQRTCLDTCSGDAACASDCAAKACAPTDSEPQPEPQPAPKQKPTPSKGGAR